MAAAEVVTVVCSIGFIIVFLAHEVIAVRAGRPKTTITAWLARSQIFAVLLGLAIGLFLSFLWIMEAP